MAPTELPPALVLSSPRHNKNGDATSQTSPGRPSAGVCFSEWSHRTTPGSSESGHPRSSRVSQALSQYGHVAKKKSHALRAKDLWHVILNHVDSEQKDMRGNNLGVQSGTCVVDDLVMQKVQRQLLLLHTLCVEYDQAAEMVGRLARTLTRDQLQQLQVLCDVLGHEHLSDFIRLSVYNTADPFAKHPIEGPDLRSARAASRARTPKAQHTIPPPPPKRQLNPPLLREETIRFAGFLPVNHPLSQAAYALSQCQEAWTQHDVRKGSDQGTTSVLMEPAPHTRSQPPSENSSTTQHLQQQDQDYQEHGMNQQQQQQKLYQQQGYHHQQLVYQQQQMEAENSAREDDQMVPLWTDMQRRWSEKNHTTIRDELLNPVVVGNPLGVYAVLPDFKRKILEAERKAQEQAKHLPRLQIPSYGASADAPYSPFSPHGRAPSSPGKPVNPHSSRMSQRDRTPNVGTARSEHGAGSSTLSPSPSYQNLNSPGGRSRFVPSSNGQASPKPPSTNPGSNSLRARFESEANFSSSRPSSTVKGGPDGPQGLNMQNAEGATPPHVSTPVSQLRAPHARSQPSPPPASTPAKLPNLRPTSTHRLATASQQE
mmetsp:Transcript_20607/g.57471  ORF Transcript_20607/g.57471 Transcript_20607/m.57471 type:complete len:597 (+) Transcript_20607:45-1835(+)